MLINLNDYFEQSTLLPLLFSDLELKRARLDRLRMIKYELLKSIIKTHPSRESSQNKIRELEKLRTRLKDRQTDLDTKIETLKKHTILLKSSIRQLISDNQ